MNFQNCALLANGQCLAKEFWQSKSNGPKERDKMSHNTIFARNDTVVESKNGKYYKMW